MPLTMVLFMLKRKLESFRWKRYTSIITRSNMRCMCEIYHIVTLQYGHPKNIFQQELQLTLNLWQQLWKNASIYGKKL